MAIKSYGHGTQAYCMLFGCRCGGGRFCFGSGRGGSRRLRDAFFFRSTICYRRYAAWLSGIVVNVKTGSLERDANRINALLENASATLALRKRTVLYTLHDLEMVGAAGALITVCGHSGGCYLTENWNLTRFFIIITHERQRTFRRIYPDCGKSK